MPDWIVSFPERLDVFLASSDRTASRVKAQKAIEEGHVKVNDVVTIKCSARLQEGDRVSLEEVEEVRVGVLEPADLGLSLLYEDDACFVINKPAGYAVHPGAGMAPGEKTILHGIAFLFAKRSLPFSEDAVLVHRLDRDTTGCLLVAKTAAAHGALQKQFETRTVHKQYLAFTAGVPTSPSATIDSPIGRSTANRTQMSVTGSHTSREAQTTYRTLAVGKQSALLLCDLHTGRTHQVRVHLSAIGHPVLGDSTYTSALSERLMDAYDIHSICLHAWKLTFASPAGGNPEVTAPLPLPFHRALERAGIEWKE